MLKKLTVWNFALIEYTTIDFTAGLNILTGETGAGKSILIGAIGLLLGQRSSAEIIRHGCTYLRTEGVFDIRSNQMVQNFLNENGIINDTDELVLARRLERNGKSIIQANGCRINLATLRILGHALIDVHGQNENQTLFEKTHQLKLVDNVVAESKAAKAAYGELYGRYLQKKQTLEEKIARAAENERQLDILRWQIEEIAKAKIVPGEQAKLEEEIKRLSNAEKIADHVNDAYHHLDSSETSVLASLAQVSKDISQLVPYDDKFRQLSQNIEDSRIQLQECAYEIRDYAEALESDPTTLNGLLRRSDEIARLCRKYGPDEADVLAYYQKILAESDEITNYEAIVAELRKQIELLEPQLQKAATQLTQLRQTGAMQLTTVLAEQIRQLGMEHAAFKLEVVDTGNYSATGRDEIKMLFSANLGEMLQLVQKVASGGEQSRIALAIKAAAADRDAPETMIFDEIDTGIGGKTAQKVAERIAVIAMEHQVLCITHLPQIAVMADVHFYIEKNVDNAQTTTKVVRLTGEEQVKEIARMASGDEFSAVSLGNAQEMLEAAHKKKMSMKRAIDERKAEDDR